MKPPPSTLVRKPPPEPSEDMTEELRAQVDTIVVIATRDPADEAVSGSYEKGTFGLVGGVVAGHEVGRIRKEVGPVPVEFRIPGTAIPGAIIGGLFGGMQHEVQQLRDALAEELVDAESTPLTDDGLAMDVYSRLRRVLESSSRIVAPTTPIPENTDAVLHVKFGGVSIDVQGRDAVRCRWSSACGEYRWSVRPSWRVGGIVRYGRWMRFPPPSEDADESEGDEQARPNGLSGRAASQAPAYTQDFPLLTLTCDRR